MDQPDIERAKMHANYKVTKEQLVELVECYRQRKYIEDITYLQDKLKGIAGVLDALDVNPEHGISSNTMNTRLQVFGTNHKDPPTRTPYCTLLLGVLDDLMLKILIVCAIFSIVVDMSFATPEERGHAWIEGASILLAVAVVSGISSFSDWRKEGQFLAQLMIEEDTKRVVVRRNGQEEEIHRNNILVGDIIMIRNGMNVPVDGVVIQSIGVMSDESAMTGESDHLPKESFEKCLQRQREHEAEDKVSRNHHDVPSPVILSGTQVQTGQGWFVCIVVGDITCEGQIMAGLS